VINNNLHPLVLFRSYRRLLFKFWRKTRSLGVFEPPLNLVAT